MTQNKDLKSEIRARMAATDEKYTQARRAVLAARGGPTDLLSEVGKAVRPGRVTAVLSGGGATNLGVALPAIGKYVAAGHPLLHTTGGRDGVLAVPNDFDFAIEIGIASADEVGRAWSGTDEDLRALTEKMEPMMRQVTTLDGRAAYSTLLDKLAERGPQGQCSILWVQDFDDGGPIALGRPELGYREELEAQMPYLRRLADETSAIIVMGHLDANLDQRSDWWPIPQHADTTFVSAHDWDEPGSENAWMVFDGTTERGLVYGQGAFTDWRSHYMQRFPAA